jgi:hypothetical protein
MKRSEAMEPLFIATERFDPSDGEGWTNYVKWARIPNLVEVVSLDGMLCPHLPRELEDEDWNHIVNADFRSNYFYHLDYLMQRIVGETRRNILGLYRNPDRHFDAAPAAGAFDFIGYDLIEEMTQVSALTNCGGFPETFVNGELNKYGLLPTFDRAREVRKLLPERNPQDDHANCEMYAVWRSVEAIQ